LKIISLQGEKIAVILIEQKLMFKFILNNLEKKLARCKNTKPREKNLQGAKVKYKTQKKIIFTLGNVNYIESFHQLSYTRSNDETVFSNVTAGEEWKCCDLKGGTLERRYGVQLRLFKNVRLYFIYDYLNFLKRLKLTS